MYRHSEMTQAHTVILQSPQFLEIDALSPVQTGYVSGLHFLRLEILVSTGVHDLEEFLVQILIDLLSHFLPDIWFVEKGIGV